MGEQSVTVNRGAPLGRQEIHVISTADGCRRIVNRLCEDCKDYNVMGFDCEWETYKGQPRQVSILQLASHRGLCAVIRLNKVFPLPVELRNLLKDRSIVKVGVAACDDASKLHQDGLEVKGCCDLRFLAERIGLTERSLAGLAKETLNITMYKDWRLRNSGWDAAVLSEEQIRYAADDAYIGVLVFKEMARRPGYHELGWLDKRYPSN